MDMAALLSISRAIITGESMHSNVIHVLSSTVACIQTTHGCSYIQLSEATGNLNLDSPDLVF